MLNAQPTSCASAASGGLAYPTVNDRASGNFFSYYAINVGGLSDGAYTLGLTADATLVSDTAGTAPTANSTATLIVDRTPPVATPTIATLTITAGAFNQTLPIPAGMFRDAISPPSALTISLVNPVPGWSLFDGASGLSGSGPASSAALTTGAFSPAPSDTPYVFLLQAMDEAGNTATAQLSLTVTAPISAALSAVSARGATGSPTSMLVAAPAADGSVTLTLNAAFGTAVAPITPASLVCRMGSLDFNSLQASGGPCGATITVSPGDGVTASRKFAFTVVLPAASATAIAGAAGRAAFQFSLSTAGVASPSGVKAAPALPVFVAIDNMPPKAGQGATGGWCYGATVGVFYSQPLTLNLFADDNTPSSALLVTAASPATQFGLTFTPGVLGTGARITGKVTAMPPGGMLYFSPTVQDAAGNTATLVNFIAIPVSPAVTGGNPTLTMKTAPLSFAKTLGASPVTSLLVDSSAAIAGVVPSTGYAGGQIFVQLSTPDIPAGACAINVAGANACTEYVSSTAFASAATYFDVNSGFVETLYGGTAVTATVGIPGLTATAINSFLSTLTYTNTNANMTAGPRTVTVFILQANNGNIVASASRTINVAIANSLPVLAAGAAGSALKYGATAADSASTLPNAGAGVTLSGEPAPLALFGTSSLSGFAPPTASDTDDMFATSASIQITSCDAARDVLFVNDKAGAFSDRALSALTNTWGLRRSVYGTWVPSTCTLVIKPIAGSTATLAAFNQALGNVFFTSKDPLNPTGWAAQVGTSVYLVATRSFSVTVTDASAGGRASAAAVSAALTGTFTISAANRNAVFNKRALYTSILSSTSPLANAYRAYSDAAGIIAYTKPFVDNSATTATLTINLGVSSVNGVFAGGAVTDADTAAIGAPTVTGPSDVTTTSSFAAGVLTVALSGFAGVSGEKTFSFNWPSALTGTNSLTLPFQVDFRAPGCTLSNAQNYVGEAALATTLPSNGGCTFAPTVIAASSTPGTTTTVSVGNFAAVNAVLASAAAQLASLSVPLAQQVVALSAQRNAARGASSVAIDPSSIVGAGSVAITTSLPTTATSALLAALPGAPADQSLSLLLGPSGQEFSKPVRVCIYVGDTPSTAYRALYVTSQVDDNDVSKGFGPLQALSDQLFNPATGQVCGSTTHFSAFVPVTLPLPTVPMVPKASGVGGACPNQCSGQGFCRKEGKCACFAGFLGYDCSSRACPSGASWGQGSGAGAGLTAVAPGGDLTVLEASVHNDAECSGRGVCDRVKAACKCFKGYEGPACQRIACPSGCSGHGKCRFLSDLPASAAAGMTPYSAWEAQRVQKCVCDGGYTGADCSQRTCPYGDDPETICSDAARQVQQVSLYYGAGQGAASSLPTGANADFSTSALALTFKAVDGSRYTTPAIASVWGTDAASGAAAAAAMASALTSLPSGVVSGVAVTADTSTAAASRTFAVTFTGPTNTGNEALLGCAFNSDGYSLGCTTAGCRPLFAQPRLLNVLSTVSLSGAVGVSPGAILLQPEGVAGGGTAGTAGAWGVETTLTLTPSTYSWGSTRVYGTATGAPEPVTPLPPSSLRASVQGPYGLLVDLGADSDLASLFASSSTVAITFKWRLPVCAVAQVSAAAPDLEKAECSNRGVCDRTAGKCTCFTGYSGSACNAQVRGSS